VSPTFASVGYPTRTSRLLACAQTGSDRPEAVDFHRPLGRRAWVSGEDSSQP